MAGDGWFFEAAVLLTVVGLGIMLYGVSLTAGTAVNGPMALGGLVVLGAIGLILVGVLRLEATAATE